MANPKSKSPLPSAFASDDAAGAEYAPNFGSTQAEQPPPKIESRPPFLYRAHPARWQVLGGKVLPCLGTLSLIPGVNNVEARRDGSISAANARAQAEERGWTVIPANTLPPSHRKPGQTTYLWSPKGRPDCVLSLYERAHPGSTVTTPDEARFVEFLEYLIDVGIVKPPQGYVLSRMLENARERHTKAQDLARNVPSAAIQVERTAAEIEAIEAAIEKYSRALPEAAGSEVDIGA